MGAPPGLSFFIGRLAQSIILQPHHFAIPQFPKRPDAGILLFPWSTWWWWWWIGRSAVSRFGDATTAQKGKPQKAGSRNITAVQGSFVVAWVLLVWWLLLRQVGRLSIVVVVPGRLVLFAVWEAFRRRRSSYFTLGRNFLMIHADETKGAGVVGLFLLRSELWPPWSTSNRAERTEHHHNMNVNICFPEIIERQQFFLPLSHLAVLFEY